MARSRARRLAVWLGAGLAVLVIAVVGGTYLYIHVIEGPAPKPFSLPSAKASSASPAVSGSAGSGSAATTSAAALTGTWTVQHGSMAGYRVQEVLFGQNNIAVGRTSSVTGSMTISAGKVTAATFTVPMATIKSDQSQRDVQFNGRIMDTSAYPTGTLKLLDPITITPVPAAGQISSYAATADLTLHGQTRKVTFQLKAERVGGGIEVTGSIPVTFADYGIGNPDFAGLVTTQNHGLLEFLIKLAK